ncbi:Maf-like protein [Deltaproteobacteria bacterium]|nr:Maf-like protein [Deltaproteobacteria bacterium]
MSLPASGLRLVLASSSPWRREICAQVGLEVEGLDPLVEEASIQAATPNLLALARARAKADSLAGPHRVVIGCDQVCHLDGVVYGKPRNDEEHRAQLRELRGRTHELVDGVSVVAAHARFDEIVTVRVTLRADVSDEEIEDYVASGDARGCAGGYRAEGPGAWLIARVEGDWFSVIGLPIFHVLTTLRALGWRSGASRHRSGALPPGTFA